MKKYILGFIFLFTSYSSLAVGLDTTTIFMSQKEGKVSQVAENTDEQGPHLIQVKVVPVNSPYDLEPIEDFDAKKEILWSPAQMILPPGKSNAFNFTYNGPKSDKEKYYAIQWTDSVISTDLDEGSKGASVLAKATISTVLVVHPFKENLNYEFNKETKELKNTGNRSFKSVAYGRCAKQDDTEEKKMCQMILYVTPGKTAKYSQIDLDQPNSTLGVWNKDKLLPVNIK